MTTSKPSDFAARGVESKRLTYAPFKPPFHYDTSFGAIVDSEGRRNLEFRLPPELQVYGWENGWKKLDAIGHRIAELMNEDAKKEGE